MNVSFSTNWRRRLLQAIIDWLMAPVPFPGMTYAPRSDHFPRRQAFWLD
jgi:hypothetical protein